MLHCESLGERQPKVVSPSKSRIQPSAISLGVSVLDLGASAAPATAARDSTSVRERKRRMVGCPRMDSRKRMGVLSPKGGSECKGLLDATDARLSCKNARRGGAGRLPWG